MIKVNFNEPNYFLPTSLDGVEFLYTYNLTDADENNLEQKEAKVSVSGNLTARYGFRLGSFNPSQDYEMLAKIILPIVEDKIIEKVKQGNLKEKEQIILYEEDYR